MRKISYRKADYRTRVAIVMGSERYGIMREWYDGTGLQCVDPDAWQGRFAERRQRSGVDAIRNVLSTGAGTVRLIVAWGVGDRECGPDPDD